MRLSKKFRLGRSQGDLDFVDVDSSRDTPIFLDPRAARKQTGQWGEACKEMLDTHFEEVEIALARQDRARLRLLLATGEPNETHLGWGTGKKSRGRGIRELGADNLADVIAGSAAAQARVLGSLEELMLFVPGIGPDFISDQATHIIKGPLIGYTQAWCRFLEIPMQKQYINYIWHPVNRSWDEGYFPLPRTEAGALLLVPRSLVRYDVTTDTNNYYSGYVAPLLKEREMQQNTKLVARRVSGELYVLMRELRGKFPEDKPAVVNYTVDFPAALDRYRKSSVVDRRRPVMDHSSLEARTGGAAPDFIDLIDQVEAIAPGKPGAHHFHRAVESLLTALLYPSLGNVVLESAIHDERKRIDITYDNIAEFGFFRWLTLNGYASAIVVVECKNYTHDLANPELDQISSRFSSGRGRVGLLVARNFNNKDLFVQRCRDTAKDGRGWVVPLDDTDLRQLAEVASASQDSVHEVAEYPLLRERFKTLLS